VGAGTSSAQRLVQEITLLQLALIRLHRTSKPARRQGLALGATLARTIAHFFPQLLAWLGAVRDTRDQDRCTYGRRFLLWMGILGFLLKLGSRRRLRFELDSPRRWPTSMAWRRPSRRPWPTPTR